MTWKARGDAEYGSLTAKVQPLPLLRKAEAVSARSGLCWLRYGPVRLCLRRDSPRLFGEWSWGSLNVLEEGVNSRKACRKQMGSAKKRVVVKSYALIFLGFFDA